MYWADSRRRSVEGPALDDAEQGLALGRGGVSRRRGKVVGVVADFGPAVGALHRPLHLGPVGAVGNALVQAHNDVRAQPLLIGNRQLRGEDVFAAVNVGAEPDVVVVHPPKSAHAEGLEAAAVGQDGPGPAHKAVQSAQPVDRGHAGAQVKVVGVAQDNLRAQVHHLVGGQRLDRGLGSHRHKHRGGHGAVGRSELTGPGQGVLVEELEGEWRIGHFGCREGTDVLAV